MANEKHPETSASQGELDLVCPHCNETFSIFLQQMSDHNRSVTCPHCGKIHPHQHPS